MVKTFKIVPEDNGVQELIEILTKHKDDIKDVFCVLRYCNGELEMLEQSVPFETLCTISKKLDFVLNCRQEEELYEDFEDEDEDTDNDDDNLDGDKNG